MVGLWLIPAGFLAAALVACVSNWLALIPWRRARSQHWTERARLYYPVRTAARSNLWVLPAILTIIALWLWPEGPHWGIIAFATGVGAVVGTVPMDLEVFPRIPLNKQVLRLTAAGWGIRFLSWFVFLTAAALMPKEFNVWTVIIAASFLALCIFWSRDGWIWLSQRLGSLLPPPERLQRIVRETADKMNVSVREIHLMRGHLAVAYAIPAGRKLLFSERFLELLTDNEIAAIAGHEIAHLRERPSAYLKRHVAWLIFFPWIFLRPALNSFGFNGFVLLLMPTMLAPIAFRNVSRKLENRADEVAHANEPEPGVYARALLRLYEDSLLPAVHSTNGATHPHLYDRLIAAGVTPDFPRPAASRSTAWHGILFSSALGIIAAVWIIRLMEN